MSEAQIQAPGTSKTVRSSCARLAAIVALFCAGCAELPFEADLPSVLTTTAPRYRPSGERLPAFDGGERGWVRVEDLLWIDRSEADAYAQGFVPDGTRSIRRNQPLPPETPATEGYRIRTDHVAIVTNLPWDRALGVARAAEIHVSRLVLAYGEALDLRLPKDPLRVVVPSTRDEFDRLLYGLVPSAATWGAFYDAIGGVVYVSVEPAPGGPLPWIADLRHEMTHQILDLSRPPSRRGRPFGPGWFWLWEGVAIHTETLGDPAGVDSGAARIARFRKRLAWNEWTPLPTLVTLEQNAFEGRHYDETAALMRYLMDPAAPTRRGAMLGLVRRLLHDQAVGEAELERTVACSLPDLERAWLATLR